ncbi:MAG: hypothetical protein AB7E47_14720 [Desulfovibrionaceae bacterium]
MAMEPIGADSSTASQTAQTIGPKKAQTATKAQGAVKEPSSNATDFSPGEAPAVRTANAGATQRVKTATRTMETTAAKQGLGAEAPAKGLSLPEQSTGKTLDTAS